MAATTSINKDFSFICHRIDKYRAAQCLFLRFIVHPRTDTPSCDEEASLGWAKSAKGARGTISVTFSWLPFPPTFALWSSIPTRHKKNTQEGVSMAHLFATSLLLACNTQLSLNKGQGAFVLSIKDKGCGWRWNVRVRVRVRCAYRCPRSKLLRCPSSVEH